MHLHYLTEQAVFDAMETSAATGRWGEDQRGDEHGAALGR